MSAAIELIDETGFFELIDETQIDKILRLGFRGLGIPARLDLQSVNPSNVG